MSDFNKEYNSKIMFDQKAKLCGLRVNKDGSLMGKLSSGIQLLIQENKFSKNDWDKYVAYMVPVKYIKKDGPVQQELTQHNEEKSNGYMPEPSYDDISAPF